MGNKSSNSFTETRPEEPGTLGKSVEKSQSAIVSRDIRTSYITRVGVGPSAAVQAKYKGMTAQDFKVPKWMENYRAQQSQEEERLAVEQPTDIVTENYASNDRYDMTYIQIKSNDDIRREFLVRMSKERVWLPPSERPPTSQSSNI